MRLSRDSGQQSRARQRFGFEMRVTCCRPDILSGGGSSQARNPDQNTLHLLTPNSNRGLLPQNPSTKPGVGLE